MTTQTPVPTAGSRLMRQLRWALAAVVIVVLAVISGRGAQSRTAADDPDRCTVTITADVLNVRAGPGTETPVVDKLSRNDVAEAERETNGAFRKLAEGRWVSSEFIRTSAGCG